jgi:hypothetical protein
MAWRPFSDTVYSAIRSKAVPLGFTTMSCPRVVSSAKAASARLRMAGGVRVAVVDGVQDLGDFVHSAYSTPRL